MGKLIDISGLNSKQRLVFFCICLILLVIGTTIITSINSDNKVIDYEKTDIYELIIDSTETKDRDIYWTLNKIILEFLKSYQTVEKMDTSDLVEYHYTGYDLDDYYKALDPEYKKFLGKKEYIEISKNMMSKMVTWNDNGFILKEQNIINTVYKLNDYEGYICKLNTVDNKNQAFIGIILDKENNEYNIFYIK
jgi:hypothetical protein